MTPTRTATRKVLLPPYALVVPALGGLGGLTFLGLKPGVARSMAGSPHALGFTLVITTLVLAATWLLPRRRVSPAVTVLAQLVPTAVAFAVAVLPAFHQVTVVEAFPGAVSAPAGAAAPAGPSVPRAERADVVARAALHGIDHDATGTALLVAPVDGSAVVRLQSLDIEPGPDYQLHLVPGRDRTRPDRGVHLGRLRGNRGAQNYDVPAGASIDGPVTVLVWCRAFGVPVAAATLG